MLARKFRLLAAALFLTICSQAATLSDNLNAKTYYTELINGSTFITAGFQTDNSSYTLTSVTALMQQDAPGTLRFSLYSNAAQPSANNLEFQPGTLLGTLTAPGTYSKTLGQVTFSGSNLLLSPDTKYWLVMSAPAGGTYEWAYASDDTGSGAGFSPSWGISTNAGQSWFTDSLQPMQMRVTADPISSTPEPSVASLLLLGLTLGAPMSLRLSSHRDQLVRLTRLRFTLPDEHSATR